MALGVLVGIEFERRSRGGRTRESPGHSRTLRRLPRRPPLSRYPAGASPSPAIIAAMSRYQMVECDECGATARLDQAADEGWVEIAEEGEGSGPSSPGTGEDMRDLCPKCALEIKPS
jgi:hypothetical protein